MEYKPLVRWWWPGLDVEENELSRELEELKTNDFGGAEIQAFMIGTPAPDADLAHRFAPNPYYYDVLEKVLRKARELGMTIDLTISSSWPPGGTWVTVEDSLRTLLMGTSMVNGPLKDPKVPSIKLPPFYRFSKILGKLMGVGLPSWALKDKKKWLSMFKLVAVVAIRPIKSSTRINHVFPRARKLDWREAIDLTRKVKPGGFVDWEVPEGKWQLFSFHAGPTLMSPISDARSSKDASSLVVDMFDKEKVHRFLDGHFKPGESSLKQYFGNPLRALFTDSQEIASEWFWTEKFFKEFKKRRGYDVVPYLPACFVPNRDNQFLHVFFQNTKPCFDFLEGIGEKIRHDWELTLSDLFAEEYCGGVSAWCHQRGLKHRIQTYGIRVDLLKAYGHSDIPETEQLFAGGNLDFLKLASSAGILNGKRLVTSESLVWMTRDYMTTPLKWKVGVDKLFVAGINQVIYHGYPYFTPWKSFPGHYPWSPPDFSSNLNRNNPFVAYFSMMNLYVARCQYIMQNGKTMANVAIYFPHFNYDYKVLKEEDMTAGYLEGHDDKPPGGPIIWYMKRVSKEIDKKFLYHQQVADKIVSRGFYYIHVNDDSLLKSRLEGDRMILGDASVNAIVLPDVKKIPLDVLKVLLDASANGVKVIFLGDVPDGQPGFLNHEKNDPEIKRLIGDISNGFHFLDKGHDVGLYMWQDLLLVPFIDSNQPLNELVFIFKNLGQDSAYFIRSTVPRVKRFKLGFHENGKKPFLLDPWTGECKPVIKYREPAIGEITAELKSSIGKITLDLEFAPYESKLLLFTSDKLCGLDDDVHVLDSNIDVFLENGKIIGFASSPGEYWVLLSNGEKVIKSVSSPGFEDIKLNDWKLSVKHREVSGDIKEIHLDLEELMDWRKKDPIKYSNGPGVYTSSFKINDVSPDGHRYFLTLSSVHDVAEVSVNGIDFPPILAPPCEVEITSAIKCDNNEINIKVIGALRNLLVGYGKTGRKEWKHYKRRQTMPVGLIGPVIIKRKKEIQFYP
ncbi:MAG: glycosyl hydrolase, partial [Promethearchaeota archaeon]